ncbi:MAG: OmpA family protein [Candidatus Zixiibacteriota bacterium]|nr:MAG: OmpA family protein [candidate division Zixibacteria bacterium]
MGRMTSLFVAACIITMLAFIFVVSASDIEENLTHQGNKARVSVGKIKDKADGCSWQEAQAVGEMLSTALTNSGKFIVLASQEEVDELIDEIELGQSEYVEEGRGADKGLMEGADVLVTGAVTDFEPDAGGAGGALGGLKKKAFGALGAKKKTAKILMDIKLIDIRTRRILKAFSLEGKSTKWKAGAVGGGWVEDVVIGGALGVYSNEPMGNAIREVLRKTVEKISKEMPEEYFRYQGSGQYTTEYGAATTPTQTTQPAAAAVSGGTQAGAATQTVATASVAENMKLYTKYDFVPGDRVIFYDDMKSDEEGEFPYRWNLDRGVYEVVTLGNEYWIMCTDDGSVRPKIPDVPLPEKYTVELEFYNNGPEYTGNYFYIHWVDDKGQNIGSFGIYGRDATWVEINSKTLADKTLPKELTKGVHVLRLMATLRSIKCYVDEERVGNVPKVENFNPVGFRLRHRPYKDPDNPTLFRGFRFAEGGKSMRQQLEETGKIVTHGILFDSGSHKIKAESFKTLKEIGKLLTDDPSLRLSIEGHTDSDGDDDYNMTLSKNRAESAKTYLINEYGVGADRLESKGWCESRSIDTNDTPEGKANNRRVELIKL